MQNNSESKYQKMRNRLDPKKVQPHIFFTAANMISLFRAFLALPIAYYLSNNNIRATLILLGIAVLSDWLDGFAARRSNEVSDYGKVLDPVADKIVGFTVLFIMVDKSGYPLWFPAILAIRDFSISLLVMHLINSRNIATGSNIPGKIFITTAALSLFFWFWDGWRETAWIMIYIATGLMFFSWFMYIYNLIKLIHNTPQNPPIRQTEKE